MHLQLLVLNAVLFVVVGLVPVFSTPCSDSVLIPSTCYAFLEPQACILGWASTSTTDERCGWCPSLGRCFPGNATAPSDGVHSCPLDDTLGAWEVGVSCSQFSGSSSFADCLAQSTCGFCVSSKVCMLGGEEGPTRGICERDWRKRLYESKTMTELKAGEVRPPLPVIAETFRAEWTFDFEWTTIGGSDAKVNSLLQTAWRGKHSAYGAVQEHYRWRVDTAYPAVNSHSATLVSEVLVRPALLNVPLAVTYIKREAPSFDPLLSCSFSATGLGVSGLDFDWLQSPGTQTLFRAWQTEVGDTGGEVRLAFWEDTSVCARLWVKEDGVTPYRMQRGSMSLAEQGCRYPNNTSTGFHYAVFEAFDDSPPIDAMPADYPALSPFRLPPYCFALNPTDVSTLPYFNSSLATSNALNQMTPVSSPSDSEKNLPDEDNLLDEDVPLRWGDCLFKQLELFAVSAEKRNQVFEDPSYLSLFPKSAATVDSKWLQHPGKGRFVVGDGALLSSGYMAAQLTWNISQVPDSHASPDRFKFLLPPFMRDTEMAGESMGQTWPMESTLNTLGASEAIRPRPTSATFKNNFARSYQAWLERLPGAARLRLGNITDDNSDTDARMQAKARDRLQLAAEVSANRMQVFFLSRLACYLFLLVCLHGLCLNFLLFFISFFLSWSVFRCCVGVQGIRH